MISFGESVSLILQLDVAQELLADQEHLRVDCLDVLNVLSGTTSFSYDLLICIGNRFVQFWGNMIATTVLSLNPLMKLADTLLFLGTVA